MTHELTGVSLAVYNDRYARKGADGKQLEHDIEQTWRRVARAIADVEYTNYPQASMAHVDALAERFYGILEGHKFVPGGRILSGAGTGDEVTFYNCFVIPQPEDSRDGILESLKTMTEIMARGGGVGINCSTIRPAGARVTSVNGTASGPVNWMEIFSTMTGKIIQQGGSRRGALMLMLDDDHPDIKAFVEAKRIDPATQKPVAIEFANVSVAVSDAFMRAVKDDALWQTQFPTKANWDGVSPVTYGKAFPARELWDLICERAWATAEPGVVFIDRCQDQANSGYYETLRTVNPCGEQPLPPYGVCNLGSMNLAAYVRDGGDGPYFSLRSFKADVALAIRFLDNVIDGTPYFLPENEAQQKGTRRIGLGTMGLADALIKLGVRYGSRESLEIIDMIYAALRDAAYAASAELARAKGAFPRFDAEQYCARPFIQELPLPLRAEIASDGIRNALLLTQAPTGTTSLLAGVSSGIEPVFSFATKRTDRTGEHLMYHPLLEAWRAAHPGEAIPDHFVASHELTPTEHVTVQARIQRYIDSSISKTVNGPHEDTVEEVKTLYMQAYDLGCKGVTYYRDGSRDAVLTRVDAQGEASGPAPATVANSIGQLPAYATGFRHRPKLLPGYTTEIATPLGDAHITINSDEDGPLEVFVTVGRSGGDVAADAEALGRVISAALRIPSPMSPAERLDLLASQLLGIGGAISVGFGPNRVRSLADGIGQVLESHADATGRVAKAAPDPALAPAAQELVERFGGSGTRQIAPRAGAPCPQCGQPTLRREEGCEKCDCGFSRC